MPGESIGRYRITAKLGEGGMGAVYRATDTKLNREVAIKVLPDTFAADPDRLARFTREAQVLASLNHPNNATIFGVEDKALVMELVEGNDLSGPLPLNEALQIAKQIAEGLEAAHDKGIIHRDLKPANIKVTPGGIVKLLDFGLAKATDAAATATSTDSPTMTRRATQAGIIMGTAGYMSPEQAAGKTVDKRADIWAFGVVLHELLTGKRLFHGETVSHTLASVLKDPIDFAIPQAPPPIQQLLARCIDRNLKHRYKDISEARITIEDFLAKPEPKEPAKSATRPTFWIALAAALCAALVASFFWPRHTQRSTSVSHFNIIGPSGTWILVSPDGKWLLKLSQGGHEVRRLDSPNWRKLPGTESSGGASCFWSEDSTAIGFVSSGRLLMITLDGTSPRDLMAVENFKGASWRGGATNGDILLATHGKLKMFNLRTGFPTDLPNQFKAGWEPSSPTFLPEGDGFVFLEENGETRHLVRSTPGSATTELLLPTRFRVSFAKHPATDKWHIFYIAGERELQSSRILQTAQVDPKTGALLSPRMKSIPGIASMANLLTGIRFSVGDGGVMSWTYDTAKLPIWQLNWVDLKGNLLSRLTDSRNYVSMALSPDESRIAAEVDDPDPHIWILDSKTGLGRRMTNSIESETYPLWSKDGNSIYYVAVSQGRRQIMRHFIDNSAPQQLLWQSTSAIERPTDLITLLGVSPEGRYLLVPSLAGNLSRLDLTAPRPAKLEAALQDSHFFYSSLSPDGRKLASRDRDGTLSVQAYPPALETRKRFSGGTGERYRQLFFSYDGLTLYAQENRNLVAFPLLPDNTMGEPKVLRPWVTSARFSATVGVPSRDGKRILLLESDQTEVLNPQVLTDWTSLLPKPML